MDVVINPSPNLDKSMFLSRFCTCIYFLFMRIPWIKPFWTWTWTWTSLNGTPLQQASVYHEHIPGRSKSDNLTYCIRLAAPWRAYQVKLKAYGGTSSWLPSYAIVKIISLINVGLILRTRPVYSDMFSRFRFFAYLSVIISWYFRLPMF